MCGILAALRGAGAPPLDAAVLRRLAALQSHRGPDGSGDTAQHDGAGFAVTDAVLLHERLAIIDVSGGAQPLFSADGQVALVANGEVYDYVRHRRELEAAPSRCVFATHSDCEVLLHLYLTHGPSFLADADVHGMFGFVIVDNRPAGHGVGDGHGGSGSYSHSDVGDGDGDGGAAAAAAATDAGDARAPDRAPRPRIIVARDHVGIVPLHWGRGKDGTVWVASEIKSLIGAAFDSVVGRDGGGGGGGVDAPLSVAHFPPASMYDSATDAVTRWYEPAYIAKTPTAPLDVTALRDALVRAVRSHMMSDVPYGVVLSGGLDSSLIAAVAARVLAEKSAGDGGDGGGVPDHQWVPPARLNTFTIGFEGSSDLKHAQIVADYIGSEHHNFVVTPDEVVGAIDASVRHLETYDAGVTRPGTMQYLLAKKIHALGVKVVLSGEGADEVFAGYWCVVSRGTDEVDACAWLCRAGCGPGVQYLFKLYRCVAQATPHRLTQAWTLPIVPPLVYSVLCGITHTLPCQALQEHRQPRGSAQGGREHARPPASQLLYARQQGHVRARRRATRAAAGQVVPQRGDGHGSCTQDARGAAWVD